MKYYIISGEASGDLHGSNLIKEIIKKDPKAEIRAWGGDKMKDAGATLVKHFKDLAFMGFYEVLINLKTILKNISYCKEDILKFSPDKIIFIDYLNICASSRMKGMGGAINSYNYIKAIAEELRGLAVEFNVPLFSATQTTRSGYSNSDVGLEDTSESFGLPATADLMFAIISTEELQNRGQMMVKQLKNPLELVIVKELEKLVRLEI